MSRNLKIPPYSQYFLYKLHPHPVHRRKKKTAPRSRAGSYISFAPRPIFYVYGFGDFYVPLCIKSRHISTFHETEITHPYGGASACFRFKKKDGVLVMAFFCLFSF